MRVLVYENKGKDLGGAVLKELTDALNNNLIDFDIIHNEDLSSKFSADFLFVIGGDGTILWLVDFAIKNNIPIVGINLGRLGFLSEFEPSEINKAIELIKNDNFKKDYRLTLEVEYKKLKCFALNDVYLCRSYQQDVGGMTAEISVEIDNVMSEKLKGDGVVLSSPTGSTAYSLSAGGPVLEPGVNAFSITPIAAHAMNMRPIVCSADSECKFEVKGNTACRLFVDCKYIDCLSTNETVTIKKAINNIVFIRKPNYSFFERLAERLKNR